MIKKSLLLPRMITASLLFLLLASSVYGNEYRSGDLTLDHPHTLATPPGATVAAGYMVISNEGTSADRLTGGHASFASAVEVHETRIDNDVMKMRELENGLNLPPGSTVELSTGGIHLMFTGLKAQMMPGDLHTVTLMFEVAGAVEVEFVVEESAVPMDHSMHEDTKNEEAPMDHSMHEDMKNGEPGGSSAN